MANTCPRRRCYGYVRVSTLRQGELGDSLETQRQAIALIAQLEGFDLVEVFADTATSGGTPLSERPEGGKLLKRVQSGDLIVCTKLDRFSRDALDAANVLKYLKRHNVGLYLKDLGGNVTDTNVSALIFGVLSNIAEFERSRIAERIAEVKRNQKSEGRFLGGGVPFGFKRSVDDARAYLVADLEVQAEAAKLRARGYSARSAAGALTALGHATTHKSVLKLWRMLDAGNRPSP